MHLLTSLEIDVVGVHIPAVIIVESLVLISIDKEVIGRHIASGKFI
jgi:hypothetical protein